MTQIDRYKAKANQVFSTLKKKKEYASEKIKDKKEEVLQKLEPKIIELDKMKKKGQAAILSFIDRVKARNG
jgi:superfamily I DNA and RNA helicase